MLKYIIKRLLTSILLSVGAIFAVSAIMYFTPGDPAAFSLGFDATPEAIWEWREMHGLNDPVLIQYARYMARVFRGDFGVSLRDGAPIAPMINQHLPHTLRLSLVALSFSLLLAVPVGIIAAIKRNTWIDKMSMLIALMGISMPIMWLGIILILFHVSFWGIGPPSLNWYLQTMWPFIIFTLGIGILSAMIRTTRFSMLEAMEQNYIRTARAKGLSGGKIIRKHVLPNIVIPVLASFKVHLGTFFTSIILAEAVFLWPGIGRLMIRSIIGRDFFVLLACLIVFILFFALINFIVDIAKAFADPVMRRGRLC